LTGEVYCADTGVDVIV